ncbi:MAG: hypothetical protein BWY65_00687 [Firmicutes bacterium ADurb.Bin373]|nr:MAG: hypothetical protein BWY65_00687 [Firmicutes bacterium ADurb.Bin373]
MLMMTIMRQIIELPAPYYKTGRHAIRQGFNKLKYY